MRYLILGNGPAGIAGAKAIRKRDKKGMVLIVTKETAAPYLTPLLPGLISGETDMETISDPQGEGLDDLGIDVRQGKAATLVDTGGRTVIFSDNSEESYDRLLIATGGTMVLPPPFEKHREFVFPLNTLADALRIKEGVKSTRSAAVYGPGFLAIEACRVLRSAGQDVTWFKPDLPKHGYPIASGEFESRFLDDLRIRGVTIKKGTDVADAVSKEAGSISVTGTDGEAVACEMIVAATERFPAVDFLAGSGVDIDTGIRVNDHLQTNVPDVYAAGDCAELIDIETGGTRINFGWRSAIKQGQLAGENMSGKEKRYIRRGEDYLWLIFGPSLQDRMK